jgi:guanine deaminase
MDRESSATYVEPSPDVSVVNTKKLIDYIRSISTLPKSSLLITPVITLRFAIACTDGLLECLGKLASSDFTLTIQTHISENHEKIKKTSCLFPKAWNYAEVCEMFGLLRHNTILGHACHFNEDEIKLVKRHSAGVAHYPTSNFNFRSGIAPIGLYLDRGIKVSDTEICSRLSLMCDLGTDVLGGS